MIGETPYGQVNVPTHNPVTSTDIGFTPSGPVVAQPVSARASITDANVRMLRLPQNPVQLIVAPGASGPVTLDSPSRQITSVPVLPLTFENGAIGWKIAALP